MRDLTETGPVNVPAAPPRFVGSSPCSGSLASATVAQRDKVVDGLNPGPGDPNQCKASRRSNNGSGRKSAPSSSSRSNTTSTAGRRAAACSMRPGRGREARRHSNSSKSDRPSAFGTISSASSATSPGSIASAATVSGNAFAVDRPERDNNCTPVRFLRASARKPSGFSSKIQSSRVGGASAIVGWQVLVGHHAGRMGAATGEPQSRYSLHSHD